MMRIPKRTKIAGHWVNTKYFRKLNIGKTDLLGCADYAHDEIALVKGYGGKKLTKNKRAEVYLHEIVHHIADKYGVKWGEKKVNRIAAGLFQTLHDNHLRF